MTATNQPKGVENNPLYDSCHQAIPRADLLYYWFYAFTSVTLTKCCEFSGSTHASVDGADTSSAGFAAAGAVLFQNAKHFVRGSHRKVYN